MKDLDKYSGIKINNIENTRMHESYGKVPIISVEKEKNTLTSLTQRKNPACLSNQ